MLEQTPAREVVDRRNDRGVSVSRVAVTGSGAPPFFSARIGDELLRRNSVRDKSFKQYRCSRLVMFTVTRSR